MWESRLLKLDCMIQRRISKRNRYHIRLVWNYPDLIRTYLFQRHEMNTVLVLNYSRISQEKESPTQVFGTLQGKPHCLSSSWYEGSILLKSGEQLGNGLEEPITRKELQPGCLPSSIQGSGKPGQRKTAPEPPLEESEMIK